MWDCRYQHSCAIYWEQSAAHEGCHLHHLQTYINIWPKKQTKSKHVNMPMSRGYTMHALWNLDLCWPKALYNRGNSVSEGKAIVPMENVKCKTQTILLLNNDAKKNVLLLCHLIGFVKLYYNYCVLEVNINVLQSCHIEMQSLSNHNPRPYSWVWL